MKIYCAKLGGIFIKVIVFGIGSGYKKAVEKFKDVIDIVCLCDNDKTKHNKIIDGKLIISPMQIKEYEYDYIMITSQYAKQIKKQLIELGIEEHKILDVIYLFFTYRQRKANRILKDEFKNLFGKNPSREEFDAIVTGMSYSLKGINKKKLNKKTEIFALSSQDLYYDFLAVKRIIENNIYSNIKYAIIGLAYYSFHYDLSLIQSQDRYRCIDIYEPVFKDTHNYKDDKEWNKFDTFIESMFHKDLIIEDFKYQSEYINIEDTINENNKDFMEQLGKDLALAWEKKIYPHTITENISIFNDLINMLLKSNILPIVVIFPTHESYHRHFPINIKNMFYNILDLFKSIYNFDVLDFFDSAIFNDNDFFDPHHINYQGSIKFTELLNKELNW